MSWARSLLQRILMFLFQRRDYPWLLERPYFNPMDLRQNYKAVLSAAVYTKHDSRNFDGLAPWQHRTPVLSKGHSQFEQWE